MSNSNYAERSAIALEIIANLLTAAAAGKLAGGTFIPDTAEPKAEPKAENAKVEPKKVAGKTTAKTEAKKATKDDVRVALNAYAEVTDLKTAKGVMALVIPGAEALGSIPTDRYQDVIDKANELTAAKKAGAATDTGEDF